ncbi:MAG: HAMP domain-containing protein, partial [Planctomycetota bacterium]
MNRADRLAGRIFSKVAWWLLSVPIFIKVLGISLLAALIFGGITLFYTSSTLSRGLYHVLEDRARFSATWLAAALERAIERGDTIAVREKLTHAREVMPDVRYILVRSPDGRITADTFSIGVPRDPERLWRPAPNTDCEVEALGSSEGLIMEARCPILNGKSGFLQLGIIDREITTEIGSLTRSVLWTLAFSLLLGTMLGLLLTHLLLTRPIYDLVRATNRVRQGDFDARCKVFSADETGRLAEAFNQMAESLRQY